MPLPNHCSDELLLAHLDGELAPADERVIQRHLKSCWECRARSAEIEHQVQALAAAISRQTFPGPHKIAAARARYLAWEAEFERNTLAPPAMRALPRTSTRASRVAVAAALGVLLGFTLWTDRRPRSLDARQVLASVQGRDEEWERSPVHQVFRVELREVSPAPRKRAGRLEVWTEPERRRLAARWRDESGNLQRGVWRTDDGTYYIYNRRTAAGVTSLNSVSMNGSSLSELASRGLDLHQIEDRFLEWIRGRQWRPVAFGPEMARFAARSGAFLQAERDGRTVRLTARGGDAGSETWILLEIDEATHLVSAASIRFESGGRTVELRIVAERVEQVPRPMLRAAVFRPDVPVPMSRVRSAPRPPASAAPHDFALAPAVAGPGDLAAAEIEAAYVLHRLGACLGEPVEVVRETGQVVVRGLAATERRKQELLTALAEVQAGPLSTEIQTVDEALHNAPPAAASAGERTEVRSGQLPVQSYLDEHFRGDRGSVARFATEVIASSDAALAHAWALQRLNERLNGGEFSSLRPQTRWLVEVMVRDHENAVRGIATQTRAMLEPVLGPLAGTSAPALSGRDPTEFLERSNRLIHALFAGADLEGRSVDQAIQELWQVLRGW